MVFDSHRWTQAGINLQLLVQKSAEDIKQQWAYIFQPLVFKCDFHQQDSHASYYLVIWIYIFLAQNIVNPS